MLFRLVRNDMPDRCFGEIASKVSGNASAMRVCYFERPLDLVLGRYSIEVCPYDDFSQPPDKHLRH
jgi:hypothetical protein